MWTEIETGRERTNLRLHPTGHPQTHAGQMLVAFGDKIEVYLTLEITESALRESIYSVAGPASRDTPLVGSLIALAVLGGLVRPGVARSVRGMKASSRRMHTMFLGRYGHLVGQRRRD